MHERDEPLDIQLLFCSFTPPPPPAPPPPAPFLGHVNQKTDHLLCSMPQSVLNLVYMFTTELW